MLFFDSVAGHEDWMQTKCLVCVVYEGPGVPVIRRFHGSIDEM